VLTHMCTSAHTLVCMHVFAYEIEPHISALSLMSLFKIITWIAMRERKEVYHIIMSYNQYRKRR
jgi:hypothetical protein